MRTAFAALLAVLAASPAFALPYTGIYFFGDSLTDTGNVQELYATLPKPPGAPAVVPGPPYDPEGRASNGIVYADALAVGLGLTATASNRGGNNFAYGGARTRYQRPFGPPFPGILEQVDQFIARPGPADPEALYVLWGGSNNLQDILLGRTVDLLGNPIPNIPQTLGDISAMIQALYAEGARTLLVPNVANLARVPRVRELGPAAQAGATFVSLAYNQGLDSVLDLLESTIADLEIIRFDTFAALESIVLNAAALGFTNTTDRCYTGDDLGFTGGGTVCANPDEYVFWDGIHPTEATHRILGRNMLNAVVPEPASLALLAVGLMAVGWTRRKSRVKQR